jgi:hypothetical protein
MLQNNFTITNGIKLKFISYKLSRYFLSIYTLSSKSNFFKNLSHKHIVDNSPNFYFFNKNFIDFFYYYCYTKNNFIILNDDYTSIYPLYKQIYGNNFLHIYKNFLFFKPINFTFKSWLYFFSKFCKNNKINLMFVFDYDYYINFYKNISEVDLSVSAIVPYSYINDYIDYPLYSYSLDIFTKLIYSSCILQIYSLSYNSLNMINQYKYIQVFYKFCNTKI